MVKMWRGPIFEKKFFWPLMPENWDFSDLTLLFFSDFMQKYANLQSPVHLIVFSFFSVKFSSIFDCLYQVGPINIQFVIICVVGR